MPNIKDQICGGDQFEALADASQNPNRAVAIPEGFTAHRGTECPCPGQAADVMFEDGHISKACVQMPKADGWFWGHGTTRTANIVAYRVIENPGF